MSDDVRFAILAELRNRQSGSRSESEWASYKAIAMSRKTALDYVIQHCDALRAEGLIEARTINGRALEVRITESGTAALETWIAAQEAAISDPLRRSETIKEYGHQLFVSYASENIAFIDPIVEKLTDARIKSWYDRNTMKTGAEALGEINDGIADAQSFLVFASPHYFTKPFAKTELATILHLTMFDPDRRLIVVLFEMSQEDLRRQHPLLSARTNIDAALFTTDDIIKAIAHELLTGQQIIDLDKKATIETGPQRIDQLEPSIYVPGGHNPPFDKLEDAVIVQRPTLEISWYLPGFVEHVFSIQWGIRNRGPRTAHSVAVFMPGLQVYSIKKLDPGEEVVHRIRYDDRYAYFEIMKPPVSAVIECNDEERRIYRQYATVNAFPKWGEHEAEYVTTELGYPYLVAKRIVVPDDDDDRFHRSRAIGWDPD